MLIIGGSSEGVGFLPQEMQTAVLNEKNVQKTDAETQDKAAVQDNLEEAQAGADVQEAEVGTLTELAKKTAADKSGEQDEAQAVQQEPTETVSPDIVAAQSMYCRGKEKNTLEVGAVFSQMVESADNYYYLMRIDPVSGKLNKKAEAALEKSKQVTFILDTSQKPHLAVGRYCIAVKTKKGFVRVSPVCYVEHPEKMAANREKYEIAATKKGIQDSNADTALATDSKQIFVNMCVSDILREEDKMVSYSYDGKVYQFNSLAGYQAMIEKCNANNIVVTIQILLDWCDSSLIIEEGREKGHSYYTWNTRETDSRVKMEAIFSYIAEKFGKKDCYVTNWILGNEVNSCNYWNYCGDLPESTYITVYAEAFRSLYNAVRSKKSGTKVFICLDHNWNLTSGGYSSKYILDTFAKTIDRIQPEVQWNLAYHAYPTPLTEVAFWKNTNITNDVQSPVIHMQNLQVLTDYVKNSFGSNRRILLSEQGFTSTQGEELQAAALAYAYYIAACNSMVDGFHIRSFEDAPTEVEQGLVMGIKGRKALEVYQYMDTKKGLSYTNPYLKLVGLESWAEIPGYSEEKLYTNYRE